MSESHRSRVLKGTLKIVWSMASFHAGFQPRCHPWSYHRWMRTTAAGAPCLSPCSPDLGGARQRSWPSRHRLRFPGPGLCLPPAPSPLLPLLLVLQWYQLLTFPENAILCHIFFFWNSFSHYLPRELLFILQNPHQTPCRKSVLTDWRESYNHVPYL